MLLVYLVPSYKVVIGVNVDDVSPTWETISPNFVEGLEMDRSHKR